MPGASQRLGIDFHETYSPVANLNSIRLLFAQASIEGLEILQFDIKAAFLYGDLNEKVYLESPEGYKLDENQVYLLHRSMYGLKQAPRMWNQKFSNFLRQQGLNQSDADNCIFHKDGLFIALYVDDGIIFCRDLMVGHKLIENLEKQFEVSTVQTGVFLGFQYKRTNKHEILIHQERYISKLIRKFNMDDANPTTIPVVKEDRRVVSP